MSKRSLIKSILNCVIQEFVYLPRLSQPNNAYFFLFYCSFFFLSNFKIIITKPILKVAPLKWVISYTKYIHKHIITQIYVYVMWHIFYTNECNYTYIIHYKWPNMFSFNHFIFKSYKLHYVRIIHVKQFIYVIGYFVTPQLGFNFIFKSHN